MSTTDSTTFKFYAFFFKWIDPIIALGGAYLNFIDPIGAVTSMAPNSRYDPDQVFLFHQSGGLALAVAFLSATIPRYSQDIAVWGILQFSLLLSDLAGISGVGFAMARQGRLGGSWTSDDWGCGGSYVFLTLERAQIRVWDVKNAMDYPEPGDYDVLIITGAPANPEGEEPWLLKLREYVKKEVETTSTQKFVGFCFGHQILAMAYGLSVECNDLGYEFSATTIQLSDAGKRLFKQDSVCLNEGHQFQVKDQDLGQLQNLGSTDHTHIQGLFLPKRLWSLQAHPEFDAEALGQILEFAKSKLSEEDYQSARERNTGNVEQQVALDSLVNFILD
ncbi:beta-mannosidase mndA [Fusarium subglutinans]|uniref:Beta-mannosidase mndA n=1 Tax=Gibberella subglutinans TaxID=42677 RepID=A0A8H5P281_GIBSU|nr:beta-mannosidase mndA [Fusarium subglutinans]KAF5585428.1 beta-mannosidase mndA [Fusarium subglutinans]